MNILIINNKTKHLDEIIKLLKNHSVTTIDLEKLDLSGIPSFNLAILTGSSERSVIGNEEFYLKELSLINQAKVPIIGICLGCELIAYTFGAKLEKMKHREEGILEIEVIRKDKIFKGEINFDAYEAHAWAIKEVKAPLIGLAKTEDGYEVIKHQTLPIYGFQFHPEVKVEFSNLNLIESVIQVIKSTSN